MVQSSFRCWVLPRTTERVSLAFPENPKARSCRFSDVVLPHFSLPCLPRRRNLLRSALAYPVGKGRIDYLNCVARLSAVEAAAPLGCPQGILAQGSARCSFCFVRTAAADLAVWLDSLQVAACGTVATQIGIRPEKSASRRLSQRVAGFRRRKGVLGSRSGDPLPRHSFRVPFIRPECSCSRTIIDKALATR